MKRREKSFLQRKFLLKVSSLELNPSSRSKLSLGNNRSGPPAWWLGVGLTTPHPKKQACCETYQWASDLDGFFLTARKSET
jgi:hypothetical protein